MNDVIHDIQSRSTTDLNTSRKSVASNHINGDHMDGTTTSDPVTQVDSNESPIRSMSQPVLVDHQEQQNESSPLLLVRQDESLSDIDDALGIKTQPNNGTMTADDLTDQPRLRQTDNQLDDNDDFFNTKVATVDDDQQPSSVTKQHVLDETTQFGTTSPPRAQSVSSKQSVRITPDEVNITRSMFHRTTNHSLIFLRHQFLVMKNVRN